MLTLDIYLYVLKMPLYIFKVIKLYNFLYFGSLNKTSFYFTKNKTLKSASLDTICISDALFYY